MKKENEKKSYYYLAYYYVGRVPFWAATSRGQGLSVDARDALP